MFFDEDLFFELTEAVSDDSSETVSDVEFSAVSSAPQPAKMSIVKSAAKNKDKNFFIIFLSYFKNVVISLKSLRFFVRSFSSDIAYPKAIISFTGFSS